MAEQVSTGVHGAQERTASDWQPEGSHFQGADRPTWELYSTCIHCGLCLNHCPTYRALGVEMDSPRGRIYQVLQVDSGQLAIGKSFVTHIDRCLDCRACESACPSGVQYGRIVERARAQIEQRYRRPLLARTLRNFFYKHVLASPGKLQRAARLLRVYQRSGLQKLARATGVLKLLGTAELEALSPAIDHRFFYDQFGTTVAAVGERRARVAFHAGCIQNVAFSALNAATVSLLTKNGVEVWIPPAQQCCGALHAHAGFREEARELARTNIAAIPIDGIDAIITNAAGCGSTLKEYGDLLPLSTKNGASIKPGDEHGAAGAFSRKVKDVTEFLAELGLRPPARPLNKRVIYQDACHLAHGQLIRSAPRDLLRAVGATLVELPHWDQCCGSAGTYNVTQNELSMKILGAKMDDIEATPADLLVTANVGCMLQLRAGAAIRHLSLPVMHIVEALESCY